MPRRDNSAIPRQTGSLLSQLRSSAFVGPRLSALGILGEAARSGSARHAAGRCTAISRPPEPPGACIRAWPHDHDSRKRPSRLAITDNGSGRVGCGPPAWACLYICHMQSCGALPNASLPRWRLSTAGPFHERTYSVISLLGDAAGSGDGEIAKVSHAFQPRVGSRVGPEFTRAPARGPGSGSTATLRGR